MSNTARRTLTVHVANAQREARVPTGRMARLARRMARCLRMGGQGRIVLTFVSARAIRRVNNRFLRHDRVTDVISFRYGDPMVPGRVRQEPIIGEILIAPAQAKRFARRAGIAYDEELSRYVAHGLLHWLGHEDATQAQQRAMRRREDRLLARCGVLSEPRGLLRGESKDREQATP